MTTRFLPGDPPVEITLRRSRSSRRFSLRVSQLDGRVTLSIPSRARETEALAFAEGQADWIRRAMDRAGLFVVVAHGACVPFEGRLLHVTPGTGRIPGVSAGEIAVPGAADRAAARLQAFLKVTARQRLADACDNYAACLGRRYTSLTMRDPRSRWGSCTARGGLMFSWRLVMAPPAVLDYVAAHEVAHLVEMNHSAAFWRVVAALVPDYALHRQWLREKGADLHRYRFGD